MFYATFLHKKDFAFMLLKQCLSAVQSTHSHSLLPSLGAIIALLQKSGCHLPERSCGIGTTSIGWYFSSLSFFFLTLLMMAFWQLKSKHGMALREKSEFWGAQEDVNKESDS